jgi:hypothetical protein
MQSEPFVLLHQSIGAMKPGGLSANGSVNGSVAFPCFIGLFRRT